MDWKAVKDKITGVDSVILYPHHEIHGGSRFHLTYSVASLGAMTSPDDMITLTFVTPDTTQWAHFTFSAYGTAGWRLRFIEGGTGGGASPTGQLTPYNLNRNSSTTATIKDKSSSTANSVDYDATLVTGGTSLVDRYIEGSGSGALASNGDASARAEWLLKQNTQYQVSLYGTDTNAATLEIDWYQHTNR